MCGSYPRAAVGSLEGLQRLLGGRIFPGGRWFARSPDMLRVGLLERDDVRSGNLVQIPGADCFHRGSVVGFMSRKYG
jgi:hypothetical protein